MSLREYLLPDKPAAVREIEARCMSLAVRLRDETSKSQPDATLIGHMLDDMETLVADYRRETTRKASET